MRRLPLLSLIFLSTPVPAAAQNVDDQLKQQQLQAAILTNEKARLALVDPLRSITPPDAKVATPEKAAEALLLRTMVYQGLAARLADQIVIPAGTTAAQITPVLVMGAAPPTRAHWTAFSAQRTKLAADLKAGRDRWRTVRAAYCLTHGGCSKSALSLVVPVAAAVQAATTLYSLFKTDLSVAGSSLQVTDGDFESFILRALQSRFTVDMSRYGTPDGQADTEDLLRPVAADYAVTKKAYIEEYLPILAGAEGGKPEKIGDNDVAAAGQVLKTLIDAYEALEKALYTESDGQLTATTIEREALMSIDRATSPVLFVTGQDAALTTATRKSVFIRAATATTLTVAATANYTIVTGDQVPPAPAPRRETVTATLGTLSCVIRDRQPSSLFGFNPADDPSTWDSNCDGKSAHLARGSPNRSNSD